MDSSSSPLATQDSVNTLMDLVKSLHVKIDKLFDIKSTKAVLVGSTEKSTNEETAKCDEETLKVIIAKTNDKQLKDAYEAGEITHKRFPENKAPGKRFLRRDLMPSELEQERIARDEARRRNLDSDCLRWGVRDC
ncbi:hypothetical protein PENTCL1PPCAC_26867, partial [Pristionchus entomophagus]